MSDEGDLGRDPDRDSDRPMPPGPAWLGPKASEDEAVYRSASAKGLSMRAVLPNAITAAALCSGLTGIRFAIEGDWEKTVFAIILAGLKFFSFCTTAPLL